MLRNAILAGAAGAAMVLASPLSLPPNSLLPLPTVATAEAATATVDINFFFTALEPYGYWTSTERYPYVWVPANVGPDWAPYVNGEWEYTAEYGWYFVSDEPFAEITYHYGRWGYDPNIGRYWVPGTEWAPAWVVWREGEDH